MLTEHQQQHGERQLQEQRRLLSLPFNSGCQTCRGARLSRILICSTRLFPPSQMQHHQSRIQRLLPVHLFQARALLPQQPRRLLTLCLSLDWTTRSATLSTACQPVSPPELTMPGSRAGNGVSRAAPTKGCSGMRARTEAWQSAHRKEQRA